MTSTPLLVTPDFTTTFILEFDASRTALGSFLIQDKHPIDFESWKLKPTKQTKSIDDNEKLAIMHALFKWKQYLFGVKFLVKIYHNSLKYFIIQRNLSLEQQKWESKIQVFYFNILYKNGKENRVVDNLSRKNESYASLCAISIVVPRWISEFQSEYVKDTETRKIIE